MNREWAIRTDRRPPHGPVLVASPTKEPHYVCGHCKKKLGDVSTIRGLAQRQSWGKCDHCHRRFDLTYLSSM